MSEHAVKQNLLLNRTRVHHAGMEMGILEHFHGWLPSFLNSSRLNSTPPVQCKVITQLDLNLAFSTFRTRKEN